MEERIAKVISVLFHPMFMPVYSLLLFFSSDNYFSLSLNLKAKMLLLIMVVSATLLLPVVLFVILKRKHMMSSYHMESRDDRTIPYLIVTFMYFLLYQLFIRTALPYVYAQYMLSASLLTLLILVVNIKWKISAHMAGIGGITGLFVAVSYKMMMDFQLLIYILILLAGIIGYARLKLNAHKAAEVYTGYITGLSVFLLMSLFS